MGMAPWCQWQTLRRKGIIRAMTTSEAERSITVELYGMPRHRAGVAELTVTARTVGELLEAVVRDCPGLASLVEGGRLAPQYLLSISGQRFVSDLGQVLQAGDRVLLLSADVGG